MDVNSVTSITFSPTGTTRKIIEAFTKGLSISNTIVIDITNEKIRSNSRIDIRSDLVVFGFPVYPAFSRLITRECIKP
jgi:hypothetical protein